MADIPPGRPGDGEAKEEIVKKAFSRRRVTLARVDDCRGREVSKNDDPVLRSGLCTASSSDLCLHFGEIS